MPARAMWKGVISFGSTRVPVKLYSAVQDQSVHFRLLERKDDARVQQRMVNPVTDEAVPYAEVRRGYPLEDGRFVVLSKEELEKLEPEPSRDITLSSFVPPASVSHVWYLRPYYLGPDGDERAYFRLCRALAEAQVEGVAHWVMRGIEYTGVLRVEGSYLMLITLRHVEEVISAEQLPKPSGRAHSEKEARMAEQLVASFEDTFDPKAYNDEYRERVRHLLEQKARGERIELPKPREKKQPEQSLAEVLAASLKKVKPKEKEHRHASKRASA